MQKINQRSVNFWHTFHHIYISCFVACVLVILDYYGHLYWLDAISLRFTSALHGTTSNPQKEIMNDSPVVLEISNQLFETEFNQQSPLDRVKLSILLNKIMDYAPGLIAIDLDLSPAFDNKIDSDKQETLDNTLATIANKTHSRIILSTPFSVESEDLFIIKYRWMREMCERGVEFALATIHLEQAVALRYDPHIPSLGNKAASSDHHQGDTLCVKIKKGPEYSGFLSKLMPASFGTDDQHKKPLNTDTFSEKSSIVKSITSLTNPYENLELKNKAVFIGSGFNPQDEFITPIGKASGVQIHAATYYSNLHPKDTVSHKTAVIFDIVLGFLCGTIFSKFWEFYFKFSQRVESLEKITIIQYIATRLLLVSNLLLPIIITSTVFAASSWLFRMNLWLSPAPMIVGVFIKSILSSKSGGEHHSTPHMDSNKVSGKYRILNFILKHDILIFTPLLVWSTTLLFMAH